MSDRAPGLYEVTDSVGSKSYREFDGKQWVCHTIPPFAHYHIRGPLVPQSQPAAPVGVEEAKREFRTGADNQCWSDPKTFLPLHISERITNKAAEIFSRAAASPASLEAVAMLLDQANVPAFAGGGEGDAEVRINVLDRLRCLVRERDAAVRRSMAVKPAASPEPATSRLDAVTRDLLVTQSKIISGALKMAVDKSPQEAITHIVDWLCECGATEDMETERLVKLWGEATDRKRAENARRLVEPAPCPECEKLDKFRRDTCYALKLPETATWQEIVSALSMGAKAEPEVVHGGEGVTLREGVWIEFRDGVRFGNPFLSVADGYKYSGVPRSEFVRVGDIPAAPPKPAPPATVMPVGPAPVRIVARKDGVARHGVITSRAVRLFDSDGDEPFTYYSREATERDGWEIEVEGKG